MIGQGLPWLQAVKYLKQITDAVGFLHSKGVIYLNWESKLHIFIVTILIPLNAVAFNMKKALLRT